jgi:hypothetical protein
VRPLVGHASGLRESPVFVRDNIRDIKGRIVWACALYRFLMKLRIKISHWSGRLTGHGSTLPSPDLQHLLQKRATNLRPIGRLNPLYPENGLGSLRLRGKLNEKIMTYLSDIMRL